MININSAEIEKEVSLLKGLIEEYEQNYIKLFSELSDASYYWREDGNAKKFFNDLKFERISEDEQYTALLNTYKIYEYIKNKYKQIGKTISVNIEERDNILAKFNKCIEETTEIITLYSHQDVSFCPYEKNLIINQIKRLQSLRTKYKNTKTIVKDTMDRIIEIEQEINKRIASYEIQKVTYFDQHKYFVG